MLFLFITNLEYLKCSAILVITRQSINADIKPASNITNKAESALNGGRGRMDNNNNNNTGIHNYIAQILQLQ